MNLDKKKTFHLPRLGGRIVKTSIAVFICLMIYMLRGYDGMPAQSCIAAIVCMQPFVQDSKTFALNRMIGTFIGAVTGLLMLLTLSRGHFIFYGMPVAFAMEAIGMIITFYICVCIKKTDTSGLAAIVYLCIVISYPYIEDPVISAMDRMFDTFIGTIVAILVNTFQLPRGRNENRLFFIRAKDLVPDRYSHINGTVLIALKRLFNDGAKICMITEHAPAFFILQMGMIKVNMPLIVMDGAALYNTEDKEFSHLIEMEKSAAHNLTHILQGMNISYYVNTIRSNSLMIYHDGEYTEYENLVYEDLKRSPYRNYVSGLYTEADHIISFKIIDSNEKIAALCKDLNALLPESRYRVVNRPHSTRKEISCLYVYSADATLEQAKKNVMELMQQEKTLIPTDVYAKHEYETERDGLYILNKVRNMYEPVSLKALFRKKRGSK